jgi:hypothetical protein
MVLKGERQATSDALAMAGIDSMRGLCWHDEPDGTGRMYLQVADEPVADERDLMREDWL